jgi:tetratricopeptide (TPR) repeat protein
VKSAGFKLFPKSASSAPSDPVAEPKADPLERIARNFDAVAFRQAALMMDEMEASRLAVLTPQQRAQKLAGKARDYLDRGLLLEAERLYLSAIAADTKVAEAHEGLAEVRERTGDGESARKEARTALKLEPTADAYLVLGRLDFDVGQLGEARKEAGEALKLAPQSRGAQLLLKQIEAGDSPKK